MGMLVDQGKETQKHSTKHILKPWYLAKADFFTILMLMIRQKLQIPASDGGTGTGSVALQPLWPWDAHMNCLDTRSCLWPLAAFTLTGAQSNSAPVFLHSPGFLTHFALAL